MSKKRVGTLAALAAVGLGYYWIVRAGSLEPPGPPGPTMKTLVEVEPRVAINSANTPGDGSAMFKISQPGSYYLTGNVQGQLAKDGIKVTADDVTIDLMGFQLVGPSGSAEVAINQEIPGVNGEHGLAIRHGTVRGWREGILTSSRGVAQVRELSILGTADTQYGIHVIGAAMIDSVYVSGCSVNGILVTSGPSLIQNSTVLGIGGPGVGIEVFGLATVTNCAVHRAEVGIKVSGHSCRIESNLLVSNTSRGVLAANQNSEGNVIVKNSAHGGSPGYVSYEIGPGYGNMFGPIVSGAGDISAVPNGNNPWANLTW